MNAEALHPRLNRLGRGFLLIGAAALAVCFLGALQEPEQFFRSYLVGYLFWTGIAVGSLAILMLHHLVGGGWGFVIQRLLESGTRTLWLMALLFVPLFFGIEHLYAWARPEALAADEVLRQKSLYLNRPFFVARAVLYFAVWIGLGYFLNKWSLEQDHGDAASLGRRMQLLSGPGLLLYGLTVTFSSVDWAMSLEPRWFSTIYGMMFMIGYALAALALVIGAVSLLARHEPLSRVVSEVHFHDLGNLLLALVMLWAYLAFSQFLIVWAENLREEIPWYLSRMQGGWQGIAVSLILFQFALPFLFLLSRATKRSAGSLSGVALVILFMHGVDLFWLVAPAFSPGILTLRWMDVLAPIGIGGLWLAVFVGGIGRGPLVPLRDPRFAEVLEEAKGT